MLAGDRGCREVMARPCVFTSTRPNSPRSSRHAGPGNNSIASCIPLDSNRGQLRLQSSSCQLETEFDFFMIARVEGYLAGE